MYEQIKDLAAFWDSKGKPEQPICICATRTYLRQWFKPEKRGGQLMCGSHPIELKEKPDLTAEQRWVTEGQLPLQL